jgi:tRNA A-37 threonylcarbamoyl transferase component Bud32
MREPPAPPGFVVERQSDAVRWVRASLAADARALGLFEPDGIARALAAGAALGGGRAGAASLALPAARAEVVVRPLRHGGVFGGLLGASYWGPGRVLRELAATQQLFAAGAPVPEPAFALAQRRAGPLWTCAIATARIAGVSLASAARGAARASALRAAAGAVRALHDRGGRHADLNATNLLVAERDGDARACVIDLDRARVTASVPPSRRAREIARLWRSLAKCGAPLDAGERSAFVAAYAGGDAALARELAAALRRERLRSALHAWRYARRR